MAKTPLFATASLLLALTFTISCSESDGNSDPSSSSVNDVNGESSSSIIANEGGNNLSGSSSSSVATDAGNRSSSSSVNNGSSSSTTTSGGGDFEGSKFTRSYAITSLTDNSFTYIHTYDDYDCREGGILVEDADEYSEMINYSINNRILVWEYEYDWNRDTLHFAGTSNNLIGEWTRTKNKDASCILATSEDDFYWRCKTGWDIVKAEFTSSIVKITREVCITDNLTPGEEWRGWKYMATGCNTYEMYKGADRIYVENTITSLSYNEMSFSATYKGKTCVDSRTLAQQEKACKKAWDEYGSTDRDWRDYYWDFLESDFEECIKEKGFPEELLSGYDDSDSIGAVAAKPLPKKKHGNRVVTPGLRLLGPL